MKHRYIESLLTEIKSLTSSVENLKEKNKVPFSFFKESFKHSQEITRLLHELEFVQIEEMKEQMENLVQYLSDAQKAKKEDKAAATELNKAEDSLHKKKQPICEANDTTHVVDKKTEVSVNLEIEQEQDTKETPPLLSKQNGEEKSVSFDSSAADGPIKTTVSNVPLLNNKNEAVLANLVPKGKSLNDVLPVGQTIQDAKRSISLNDRFLFQRELFDNNRDAMNTLLSKLHSLSSYDLVESYLERNTTWDFRDETVDKFLQMMKDSFK